MKLPVLALLTVMSTTALATVAEPFKQQVNSAKAPKNSIVRQMTNLQQVMNHYQFKERSEDYPTQIVRIEGKFDQDFKRDCESVHDEIDNFFNFKITSQNFYYNILTSCVFNEDTGYAREFSIDSYFDPLTDEAIAYLKTYLAEHNGRELLGTVFQVEDANGLVVSLNLDAGRIANRYDPLLVRYRHDNETHYFPNNYAMMQSFIRDTYDRFYSNDPELILPYMKRWLFSFADKVYYYVLQDSNYVELQPERIFLMTKAPHAYTSPLRMYFAHHCDKYKNKRCL